MLRRALREQDSNRDRFVSFAEFERAIRTVVERKVATQSQNALGKLLSHHIVAWQIQSFAIFALLNVCFCPRLPRI